jgi:starch phosphorylase
LGNGGLGVWRPVSDSGDAGLPGRGYGIRYDYGMFKQNIVDGRQRVPGLLAGTVNPWN